VSRHSFIVRRQGGIEIDRDCTDERLDTPREIGVHRAQAPRMVGKLLGEKTKELTDQRIIRRVGADARQHDLKGGGHDRLR
jgi:hypothetical protein